MYASIIVDIMACGGYTRPKETTTHTVSLWCIPNDEPPEIRGLVMAFFDSEPMARDFERRYILPPTLAFRLRFDDSAKRFWEDLCWEDS